MTEPRPSRRSRTTARVAIGLVSVVLLGVVGCSSDDLGDADGKPSTDRPAVVERLVDDVIVPTVQDAAESAGRFHDAVVALCAAPTTDALSAARAALAEAWSAWERTDSYDIGPVMSRRSASVVAYRVDAAKVDATVAAVPPADAETVRNRTASGLRGYGAADHLLSGVTVGSAPTDDPAPFADAARCGYLSAVAEVIADETSIVATGWTDGLDGEPPYRDTATGVGDDALTATDVIDSLVNMQISQLEAESKLLTAVVQAGPATPIDLPSAELFQLSAHVAGIEAVYGVFGEMLDGELATKVTDGTKKIGALLTDAAVAPSEAQPEKELVADLQTAVDDLRLTISTEVVSALDVTISFSENDGDS